MLRVNSVLVDEMTGEIRKPAGGDGGLPKKIVSELLKADEPFTTAFADVLQARSAVRHIIGLCERCDGLDRNNESQVRELRARFLIGWRVYTALYPSNVREAFPALMGAEAKDFEHAMQTIGWIIATPEARERHKRNPEAIITPEDLL